eukprot:7055561-Pyramimonas_sp.AAC.1
MGGRGVKSLLRHRSLMGASLGPSSGSSWGRQGAAKPFSASQKSTALLGTLGGRAVLQELLGAH